MSNIARWNAKAASKLRRSLWRGTKKETIESEHFRFRFCGDPEGKKLKMLLAAGARIEQISSEESSRR